jgi:hypothetical protein
MNTIISESSDCYSQRIEGEIIMYYHSKDWVLSDSEEEYCYKQNSKHYSEGGNCFAITTDNEDYDRDEFIKRMDEDYSINMDDYVYSDSDLPSHIDYEHKFFEVEGGNCSAITTAGETQLIN